MNSTNFFHQIDILYQIIIFCTSVKVYYYWLLLTVNFFFLLFIIMFDMFSKLSMNETEEKGISLGNMKKQIDEKINKIMRMLSFVL